MNQLHPSSIVIAVLLMVLGACASLMVSYHLEAIQQLQQEQQAFYEMYEHIEAINTNNQKP